jgi:hypothetical protein
VQTGNSGKIFLFRSDRLRFGFARAFHRFDASAGSAGHGADLSVLRFDEGPRRGVAVEPTEVDSRDLPV